MGGSFDTALLIVSFAMAVIASYSALDLGARIAVLDGRRRRYWLVLGGTALATAFWSLHVLCFNAFHFEVRLSYDWRITLLAWIAVSLLSAAALHLFASPRAGLRRELEGSLALGLGLVVMQRLSILSLRFSPVPDFAAGWSLLSLGIAIALPGAAMALRFQAARRHPQGGGLQLVPAILLAAGICGCYWCGIAALHLAPGTHSAIDNLLGGDWMGLPVAFGLSTIVAASLSLSLIDARRGEKNRRISGELARADRVRRLTYFDETTGLPNRASFNASLLKRLNIADGRMPAPFTLIHVELNNSATVAEKIGSESLTTVWTEKVVPAMKAVAAEPDTVFRFSASSMMLIVADVDDAGLQATADAIRNALPKQLDLKGSSEGFAWGLGCARFPTQGTSTQSLVQTAISQKVSAGSAGTGRSGASTSAMLTLA